MYALHDQDAEAQIMKSVGVGLGASGGDKEKDDAFKLWYVLEPAGWNGLGNFLAVALPSVAAFVPAAAFWELMAVLAGVLGAAPL